MVLISNQEMSLKEQIQKKAKEYAIKHEKIINYHHDELETDYKDIKNAYIKGAQSMLPKIEELEKRIKELEKGE